MSSSKDKAIAYPIPSRNTDPIRRKIKRSETAARRPLRIGELTAPFDTFKRGKYIHQRHAIVAYSDSATKEYKGKTIANKRNFPL